MQEQQSEKQELGVGKSSASQHLPLSPGVFGNTAWKAFLIQTSMNSQAQEDFSVINAKLANVTVKTIKIKMFQFFV